MSKIKLIVSDIDETLIDRNFKIPEYNLSMIRRARDAGIDFMIATGRIFGSARVYAKALDLNAPIIASNGAVTMDWRSRKKLLGKPIPPDLCAPIFRKIREMGLYYHFYCQENFYTEKFLFESNMICKMNAGLPEEDRFPMFQTENPEKIAEQENIYKIGVRCIGQERDLFLREFSNMEGLHLTSSLHDNFEISAEGVHKGWALQQYAEMYGIAPEEIMAFGDNHNDISMIQYAGIGVAVSNGVDELKEAANFVTDASYEGGVGKAIAKLIFQE